MCDLSAFSALHGRVIPRASARSDEPLALSAEFHELAVGIIETVERDDRLHNCDDDARRGRDSGADRVIAVGDHIHPTQRHVVVELNAEHGGFNVI